MGRKVRSENEVPSTAGWLVVGYSLIVVDHFSLCLFRILPVTDAFNRFFPIVLYLSEP